MNTSDLKQKIYLQFADQIYTLVSSIVDDKDKVHDHVARIYQQGLEETGSYSMFGAQQHLIRIALEHLVDYETKVFLNRDIPFMILLDKYDVKNQISNTVKPMMVMILSVLYHYSDSEIESLMKMKSGRAKKLIKKGKEIYLARNPETHQADPIRMRLAG